jgi:hypothetical protein
MGKRDSIAMSAPIVQEKGGPGLKAPFELVLTDIAMDFDKVYAEALSAWPPEVRLPVRSFMTGHLVDGLTDLEHAIAAQWAGGPLGVVMVTLNWTILRAVHAEFATRQTVVMAELPSVRERFEAELRLLLNGPHCEEPDRAIIREYFGE